MTSTGFGLACLGFILLSLSLRRHYRQVWPDSAMFERWTLRNRVAGYALVGVALIPCVMQEGPWIGLVLWVSMLALAAFLQALLLTWWPARSVLFGGASIALVFLGLLA
jgi:hypothetical protein